ncbi:MAG TPA: HU family DNA-binding protein [Thermodesulfovibrionia bacterium]|nr:HU family DNA-binding protein [Thermodesulfovibrionia bacterium]
MNKADIISRMAEGAGITKAQADKAMDGLLEAIQNGLKDGGKVVFVGFGTFSVVERKARTGRNPRTGEVIQIPESKAVKFTPSEGLKKAFN